MASEPSSATIASEPLTGTSEIQTDTSEPSQLEVLALNYLRNQEISTIPSRIPKLNPCSICQRVILKFQFQSFVVMDCEHLFHHQCLKKYIMQAETDPPLICPSCNVIIELTREEAVLASGKYHLQKKQTDTGQDDEELLGLVEGGSRAGQGSQSKQVTMQDQATSSIMIEDDDDNQFNSVNNRTPENQANSNDEIHATNTQNNLENQSNANSGDDTNVQESESQLRRNSSRRRTSPRITREQEKFQVLLQELSTPAKGERAENVDEEEDADGSATRAGLRVTKANQDEILCWYKYAEGFENRVRDIRTQDSSVTDPTARKGKEYIQGVCEDRNKQDQARNEKTSDRAIDAFKAYNRNLCHQAEKKGNNFEAMIFDMMNSAIEEACTDHLVKHLSANK
ncbi:11571_t:CDS:2 [Cetraspora pellucida]|uniref:11571_t:CDS:1 n=1 Tax=Cetraspora pellucida TaxID=1433469 RepID=A0ACA9LZN7_9GLOM|nr:11571_t:CDS:2 [Cetraspora pellucida]